MAQFIIVGPIAGAVADRCDRRGLAMIAVVVMMLSTSALAAVTLAGVVQVWQVVALAVIHGMAMALAQPAVQALLPNLVPADHLLNAVALSGISQHGSRVVGPLVGGILLATLGPGVAFIFAALILVLALVQLPRIQYRPEPRAESEGTSASAGGIFRDIAGGLLHIRRDPRLVAIIGCVAFHCAFTMAYESLLPRLADGIGGGSNTFSAIVMGVGAGAIAGTLGVSFIRRQSLQGGALAVTGIGSGLAMLILGAATSPAIAVVGGILAGATQASFMTISNALILQVIPDAFRGRVMSIFTMLAAGFMAFMNLCFGWLADTVGVKPLMIVPGLAWIAVFAVAALFLTELRHVLRVGQFRPRAVVASVSGT